MQAKERDFKLVGGRWFLFWKLIRHAFQALLYGKTTLTIKQKNNA